MPPEHAPLRRALLRNYDRRRYQRVEVSLLGRYMLEDRREYPCQTIDMSPGDAALVTPVQGVIGERVVAYIDHIGRIEGDILRLIDGGFVMTINATLRKKDKLASTLTWLANRADLDLPEDRRFERIVPRSDFVNISMEDGRRFRCRLVDLSQSGAAISLALKPAIGTQLLIGTLPATVMRHFDDGIGVEFTAIQTEESILEGL
jgi:c-di-GMP-binding flagellar brake protein YcgR